MPPLLWEDRPDEAEEEEEEEEEAEEEPDPADPTAPLAPVSNTDQRVGESVLPPAKIALVEHSRATN